MVLNVVGGFQLTTEQTNENFPLAHNNHQHESSARTHSARRAARNVVSPLHSPLQRSPMEHAIMKSSSPVVLPHVQYLSLHTRNQ